MAQAEVLMFQLSLGLVVQCTINDIYW